MCHRPHVVLANAVLLLAVSLPSAAAQDRPASMAAQPVLERPGLQLKLERPVRLTFADMQAPQIDCVVDASCAVTVNDSTGDIPMPADVAGVGRVQSRTFAAAAGAAAAGRTAYLYRIDMTQAFSAGEAPCVTDFTVDFGPIARLQYDGGGPLDDIFVITQGGIGTIGIFSAVRTGSSITLTFDRPVSAGQTKALGQSTHFFGLASIIAPKAETAHVGWPGLLPLAVKVRAPND